MSWNSVEGADRYGKFLINGIWQVVDTIGSLSLGYSRAEREVLSGNPYHQSHHSEARRRKIVCSN